VPLPGITSLWNPEDRSKVVKGGKTNPASLIAFSGGGSSISFQVDDTDDSSMDMGSTSVSKSQGTGKCLVYFSPCCVLFNSPETNVL
jgi:hypothetical protein